jgi:hypothetical protein
VRKIRVMGLAAVMAGTMVVGLTSAASAAPANHSVRFAAVSGSRPLTAPNVNIKTNKKGKNKFKPKVISAVFTGATSGTPACTESDISFSVTNDTTATQQLTYMSSPVLSPIPSGDVEGVCVYGTGSGALVLGLQSSSKTLTVNIS